MYGRNPAPPKKHGKDSIPPEIPSNGFRCFQSGAKWTSHDFVHPQQRAFELLVGLMEKSLSKKVRCRGPRLAGKTTTVLNSQANGSQGNPCWCPFEPHPHRKPIQVARQRSPQAPPHGPSSLGVQSVRRSGNVAWIRASTVLCVCRLRGCSLRVVFSAREVPRLNSGDSGDQIGSASQAGKCKEIYLMDIAESKGWGAGVALTASQHILFGCVSF